MATVNSGSIPQESLDEVTPGIEQPLSAWADEICTRRTDVTSIKGSAPTFSNEMTTSRGLNKDLAPGETARASRGDMGEVEFHCLRQSGLSEIYDESDIAASRFDISLIEHYFGQAEQDAATATDKKLQEVLESTSLNLEFDATSDGNGAWTDTTNGTPAQDMVDMSDLVPHATKVVVGRNVVSALRKHPETMGEIINYSGGGVMTPDHIQTIIASIFDVDVDDVHMLTRSTFNDSEFGDDYELGFLFGDVFWAGAGYDLQLFDPDHQKNRYSYSQRVEAAAKEQVGFHRYVDIKRLIRENGVTCSNAV